MSLANPALLRKLALTPILLGIACLFAGLYGAVHNQISYSVCDEYFTQFKFHQFRIPATLQDRWGAAVVGWRASWWMGIVIGCLLIPFGLAIRGATRYSFGMVRAFGSAALTTLVVGLSALAISWATIDPSQVREVQMYGNEIVDDVAFVRAGTMHNFSYLGGWVGIVSGTLVLRRERKKVSNPEVGISAHSE